MIKMKIYTGFGDKGDTALFGGEKVRKDNQRVETYGALDELNSILGVLRVQNTSAKIDGVLETVQNEIFVLGSEIATPEAARSKQFSEHIDKTHIDAVQTNIDQLSSHLPELKNFILPAGCAASATAHWARTVCRRAERQLVRLMTGTDVRNELLVYLNRLSDLLFVVARYENVINNTPDVSWLGINRK